MSTFKIDPLHSDIEFKVKHLMISTVNGRFTKFDATMEAELEDFTDATLTFEADVDSITTNITDRDNHLKSDDFFSAENYPKITFKSTEINKLDNGDYAIDGLLTIRDIELPITLSGTYNGNDVDAYGQTKYGFELEGVIKRSEYGLSFNAVGEKGGILVSDEVKLIVSIQMMKAE
jgi:polyisoprenoid-binding protein YceI